MSKIIKHSVWVSLKSFVCSWCRLLPKLHFDQGVCASELSSALLWWPATCLLSPSLGLAGTTPLSVRHALCQLQCPLGPCYWAHKVSMAVDGTIYFSQHGVGTCSILGWLTCTWHSTKEKDTLFRAWLSVVRCMCISVHVNDGRLLFLFYMRLFIWWKDTLWQLYTFISTY